MCRNGVAARVVDGDLLDLMGGSVRVVSNYGVGVDHIDLAACTVRSIVVGNTPGVLTEATADMGWALMMAAARRIPEADKFARGLGYTGYKNMIYLGRAVAGATIGIIGMGRIGTAVAKRATGFSMRILYYNRSRSEAGERDTGAEFCSLEDLLTQSDYVVLVRCMTGAITPCLTACVCVLDRLLIAHANVSRVGMQLDCSCSNKN